MPIHELREIIKDTVTLDDTGTAYFTRRINVPEGYRNTLINVDMYDENIMPRLSADGVTSGIQVYLSPYPVLRTAEEIRLTATNALSEVGPYVGTDHVLYKKSSIFTLDDFNEQQQDKIWTTEFPNDSVGATYEQDFYSPHLYLTVILWNAPGTEVNFCYSVYAQVKQRKCSHVTSAMGCYAEFLDAQCKRLTDVGVFISNDKITGYTFPMWKYGGIRPELMISGTTALRYFNRVASNASQEMISQDAFFTAFKESTKMAEFDSAFGDPTIPLPDWVQIMDVAGITSGAIRPYPPPIKFADNGNTLMF